MNAIDANRFLHDITYRTLLQEYHSLIGYITRELNQYNTIESAGVRFNNMSDLYDLKEELIQLLRDTFPLFEVYIEKHGDHYELDEGEFHICVSWKKYRDRDNQNKIDSNLA